MITEDYAVVEHGKGYYRIPGLWKEEQIEGNKKLTAEVHRYGAKIFYQMYHPGKQATLMATGGEQPVAPSAIKDPLCQTLPREISTTEIHELVKAFGKAAKRAKEAGFDGIEIHAGHGYLIAQFLSPFINKRTDEYGGCFENRVRLLDEIDTSVRENVGSGPAGLMAARTAAQCGHKVTVFEKESHLGGAFRAAAYPIGKGEFATVITSYRTQ